MKGMLDTWVALITRPLYYPHGLGVLFTVAKATPEGHNPSICHFSSPILPPPSRFIGVHRVEWHPCSPGLVNRERTLFLGQKICMPSLHPALHIAVVILVGTIGADDVVNETAATVSCPGRCSTVARSIWDLQITDEGVFVVCSLSIFFGNRKAHTNCHHSHVYCSFL